MADVRDPAIKLFGHTIHSFPDSFPLKDTDEDARQEEVESQRTDFVEAVGDPDCLSYSNNDEEDGQQAPTDQEEVQTTTDAPAQEKAERKPDKILPCPRCNSLNTKFCYYNNYNVNQPRHFCKNCQRYWTAGGTMRNVPVGSGRRKNKHAVSHYHHMVMSPNEMPNGITPSSEVSHHQVLPCSRLSVPLRRPLNDSSTVLNFGPDKPLCESMAAVLNLGECNGTIDNSSSTICGENGEEASSRSSMPSAACVEKDPPKSTGQMESEPGPGFYKEKTPPPVPFYAGPPWPFAWGSVWNGVAAMAAVQCRSDPSCSNDATNSHPLPWGIPQTMAAAAFYAPTVPYPFVPTPSSYWTGCIPGWTGGPWGLPWFPSGCGVSPFSSGNSGCSGSGGSPILGKHSRDSNLPTEEKLEKCLWIPKTLRIDDPDEAAKSSIWATLGIKPDHNEPVIKGGIFKAFRSDIEGQECASGTSQLLQVNPAALSRSRAFQENSK